MGTTVEVVVHLLVPVFVRSSRAPTASQYVILPKKVQVALAVWPRGWKWHRSGSKSLSILGWQCAPKGPALAAARFSVGLARGSRGRLVVTM